jgi:hypothetical protein
MNPKNQLMMSGDITLIAFCVKDLEFFKLI